MENPKDKILTLGASLKAGRLADVLVLTPAGEPVLFRAQGLQVIRTEADEIDTGKSCTLVVTPLASLVSSVMVRILSAFKPVLIDPMFRSLLEKLVSRITSQASSVAGSWENTACLDLVSIALAVKMPAKGKNQGSDAPRRRPEQENTEDPLTGAPIEFYARNYHQIRSSLSSAMSRGDEILDGTLEASDATQAKIKEPKWVKVAGIPGLIVGGFWVPILGPTVMIQKDTEDRVARGLSRRGLNSQLALLALANLRLRDQIQQKP